MAVQVHAHYAEIYSTLKNGADLMLSKSLWYASQDGGIARFGQDAAKDLQKKTAQYASFLYKNLTVVAEYHQPAARPDFRHFAQWAFAGPTVAWMVFQAARSTSRSVNLKTSTKYQKCCKGCWNYYCQDISKTEYDNGSWWSYSWRTMDVPLDEPGADW